MCSFIKEGKEGFSMRSTLDFSHHCSSPQETHLFRSLLPEVGHHLLRGSQGPQHCLQISPCSRHLFVAGEPVLRVLTCG